MEGKKDCVATLSEIYGAIDEAVETGLYETKSETVHDSARAIIYRHKETFKRVCKGIYMLKGKNSTSLLIEGDGRALSEIEDNSIDCIITDHPWQDKKAHKSGNQKGFAEYDTFRYNIEDFKQKARVLKPGSFMVEFLPIESSTNWEYLNEIKLMAKECDLRYYTQCIWRNAPEGTINTGKTTKGVQQILIFSKGKPRKLSRAGVNAYQTREILKYEIEILLPTKEKVHQAEKPIALYEYLIENLTEEGEVCLDQFAGSCNMLKAAINTGRFAVCYELCHEFVVKARKRLGAVALYVPEVTKFTSEIGNKIYKKCVELASEGWNGSREDLKKIDWIEDDYLDICFSNESFVSLLEKKTGIKVAA